MVDSVLISGAGIAGPVAASVLAAAGVDVTVLEVADGVRPGGQAVDIRGASRVVLDRLGLADAAQDLGLHQRGIADVDTDGRHLTEMTVETFGGDGIISELEILRGELAELLVADSRARGARFRFGTRIQQLFHRGDTIEALLSDGSSIETDLVIGADGPHSATRRLAFGQNPDQQFDPVRPIGGYMAWFTAPMIADLDGWYCMYNEPGGLTASVRPGRTITQAKASLAFASPPLSYDRRDLAAQKAILRQRFADAGWLVPQLLEAAEYADDFYLDSLVQIQLPQWSKGRVALVGDAAWCPTPLTGLGTSLAIVGAYVLGNEIATRAELPAALARYEEIMRPYVTTGQKLPPGGMRGYAPQTRAAITARLVSTRLMVSRPLRPLAKRLFFEKAAAVNLPGYSLQHR
jgi:2-polyprenyl-6-methoxyphenol hydroxylase-like FAD-dependent oxidoreductase